MTRPTTTRLTARRRARVRVELGPRVAGAMRRATIAVEGRTHCLDVAEQDLDGDLLTVGVLDDRHPAVLIELPRAGVGGEWLVVLPRSRVLVGDTRFRARVRFIPWIVGVVLSVALGAALAIWRNT
jgi:hypothetical protein